jgi:chromosome segregation ATPase
VEKELQEAKEARDKAMHDTIVNSEEMEAKIKECNQIISQMKSYDNRHGKVNNASKKIVKIAQDYEEKVATMKAKIKELISSFDAMKDKMDGMSKQMEDEFGATGNLSTNRQTLSNLYDAMVVIEGKIDKFNNQTHPDVNQIEAKCKQIHTNIQKYTSHLGSAAKHDKLSQDIYNKMQVEMKKMDELVQRNTLGHTMDGNSRAQDRAERDDVKSKIKAVQLMMKEMGPIAAWMETVLANSK